MNIQKNQPNALISEKSLYLQQHAHNPVLWMPWGEVAFDKAKQEGKLLLISIGYSSCHWCHVMEEESFNDAVTAEVMNKNFVCVKVDREERPDIDAVYMSAVQLMTGHGGWPLNCFVLPDGRPIYGGTYFRNADWNNILSQLSSMYKKEPGKFYAYAENLKSGMMKLETERAPKSFDRDSLHTVVTNWKKLFDPIHGGPNRAPKFPMPENLMFLMRYGWLHNDKQILDHCRLTLTQMSRGGIHDQLAGGFARYSVDAFWKVPHFEKMLYDNAQLLSAYCLAYKIFKDEYFKNIIVSTVEFLQREMMDATGYFYSAIDADVDGEEGKYYTWEKHEIKNMLFDNPLQSKNISVADLVCDYFSVNENEITAEGNYVLNRFADEKEILNKYHLTDDEFNLIISSAVKQMLQYRSKRKPPVTDKKLLTSWNALTIYALAECAEVLNNEHYFKLAVQAMSFIENNLFNNEVDLLHSNNASEDYNLHLEDYANIIAAYIRLYEHTWEETNLLKARKLLQHTNKLFSHEDGVLYYADAGRDKRLFVRKTDVEDNVTPSGNSVMANNLFLLGKYFDHQEMIDRSQKMVERLTEEIMAYGGAYSNWANLMIRTSHPFYEVVFTGEKSCENNSDFKSKVFANYLTARYKRDSLLPLARTQTDDDSYIYICRNNSCLLPVKSVDDAIELIFKEK